MSTDAELDAMQHKIDQALSILNGETLTIEAASKMDAGQLIRALLEQNPWITRDELIGRIPMGCYLGWFDADTMFKIRASVSQYRTHHLQELG